MTPSSPVATAVAQLVPALTDECCRHLRVLLAAELAHERVDPKQASRLGLLMQMIEDRGGLVASGDYAARRGATTESWPHHTTLARAYGSWANAQRAALRVLGVHLFVPGPHLLAGKAPPRYSRTQLLGALTDCRRAVGDWPSSTEYDHWRRLERAARLRAGALTEPLPTLSTYQRRFADWNTAITAAAEWLELGG